MHRTELGPRETYPSLDVEITFRAPLGLVFGVRLRRSNQGRVVVLTRRSIFAATNHLLTLALPPLGSNILDSRFRGNDGIRFEISPCGGCHGNCERQDYARAHSAVSHSNRQGRKLRSTAKLSLRGLCEQLGIPWRADGTSALPEAASAILRCPHILLPQGIFLPHVTMRRTNLRRRAFRLNRSSADANKRVPFCKPLKILQCK